MRDPDPETATLFLQAQELLETGEYAQAEQTLRRGGRPDLPDVHYYLGDLLNRLGRYAEAEAELRQALALDPSPAIRLGLAFTLMGQGRYPEGWAYYGARHEIPSARLPTPQDFPYPEWQGEPPAGKHIVIFPEQGFGDQIQFARFVPQLQALGAQVTLLCRPGLERLFREGLPGVRVLAAEGSVDFPDPDYWVMAGGLVGALGVTLETLSGAPYLRAARTVSGLPEGLKVGLVTQGSPTHVNDRARSLPPALAETLAAAIPGHVIRLDPAVSGAKDFADTSAIIAKLDLVVSVDTSVAHLAGAMGKPCWVLLPFLNTDWRWLRGRADSPWYDSMRLFRQGPDRDWAPVIAEVARDLAGLVAKT